MSCAGKQKESQKRKLVNPGTNTIRATPTPNIKGEDRQIQWNSQKMNRRQAELATLSPKKGGNSVTQKEPNTS